MSFANDPLHTGRTVWIIRRDLETSQYWVEGRAVIRGKCIGPSDMHLVRFEGDTFSHPRHIDLAAQVDPHTYVNALNERQGVPA